MTSDPCVAVVGATGIVGREILNVLAQRRFPIGELRLYASVASAGEDLQCGAAAALVLPFEQANFSGVDIAFLAADERVSTESATRVADAGGFAVDMSELFATDADVPLVVPEVNAAELAGVERRRIVASPNPPAIALAVVLEPLHAAAGLTRVTAVALEPVSGAGRSGIEELEQQTRHLMSGCSVDTNVFPHRIAFNLLPHVGELLAGGWTRGEQLTAVELRRLLDHPDLPTSMTRVRVPLFFGEAICASVETRETLSRADAQALLRVAAGVLVQADDSAQQYPMPVGTVGDDAVCVGRIRADEVNNVLDLWITVDNVRKGAALNAVQIAELLARDYL